MTLTSPAAPSPRSPVARAHAVAVMRDARFTRPRAANPTVNARSLQRPTSVPQARAVLTALLKLAELPFPCLISTTPDGLLFRAAQTVAVQGETQLVTHSPRQSRGQSRLQFPIT